MRGKLADHTAKQKLPYLSSILETRWRWIEYSMVYRKDLQKKVSHHSRCEVPASQLIKRQASLVTLKNSADLHSFVQPPKMTIPLSHTAEWPYKMGTASSVVP